MKYYIKINSEKESIEIQKKLFALNYRWGAHLYDKTPLNIGPSFYILIEDNVISWMSNFEFMKIILTEDKEYEKFDLNILYREEKLKRILK